MDRLLPRQAHGCTGAALARELEEAFDVIEPGERTRRQNAQRHARHARPERRVQRCERPGINVNGVL
jgi:hypothetical protein